MKEDILMLEISNILNNTGAYNQIEHLLESKYSLDLEDTICQYYFEENLIKPIIEQYEEQE